MNVIAPLASTNIRTADFVRLNNGINTYYFSTAPAAITVPAVSATPFTALSQLLKIGEAQRDIKSTANETTLTMTGIEQTMLGLVLSSNIKGSKVEMWHGFFDTAGALITTGGTGGLYKFFTGFVTGFAITEQWNEDARTYVGQISLACSPIQLILQNRNAGRYTNNNAWQFFNPGDTSMNRVSFIETINYQFGKT